MTRRQGYRCARRKGSRRARPEGERSAPEDRGARAGAVRGDLAEIGAEAAGADSRTRITANRRGSRASPAGNAGSTQARGNTGRKDMIDERGSVMKETMFIIPRPFYPANLTLSFAQFPSSDTCFDGNLHGIFHRIFEGHLDSEQAVLVGRFGFVRFHRPS